MDWYSLCKKYKVLDWIDDHIVWYVYDKPKDFIKTIRYWFHCNWNKEHWKLVKSTIVSYPWDYYFMNETLECYLNQQLRWFNKHHNVEGWYEDIVRPLTWAKNCVHAINNDNELSSYDVQNHKNNYTGPYINYRNINRYIKVQNDFRTNEVNTKDIEDYYKRFPEEYYKLKCEYILHKIIWRYSQRWWD